MTQRKTATAAMLNNWLPLPNKDMEKKCRRTALLLKRVSCGPQDTKRGKWITVLIVKVKYLPRVIIGGVHLELRFHGSHNHDGKENKKKWKDGNNLRHNLHGNSLLSHCSVINFLCPLPQTFPKATLFPIFPGYYRGDITVVRSPPLRKNEDSAYAKFGVGGGGGEVEGQTSYIRGQCNGSK